MNSVSALDTERYCQAFVRFDSNVGLCHLSVYISACKNTTTTTTITTITTDEAECFYSGVNIQPVVSGTRRSKHSRQY